MNPKSTPMIPWGPMFAAFIVLGLTRGWAGTKSLLADIFRWRVGARWYALAFLLPIGVTFAAVYLNVALGGTAPAASVFAVNELFLLIPALVITTIVAGPLTEESAWRGFFLPRLQAKYTPLVASLILGVIWWIWHMPLMVSDPTGQRPPLQFLVSILAYSIIYTWFYYNTKSSVWIVTLMHGVNNTIGAFLFRGLFNEYYSQLWWLYAGLWWIVAIVILVKSNALVQSGEVTSLSQNQNATI